MNVLGRNIEKGEKVIDDRGDIWTVEGGFGLSEFTRGTAIFGKRVHDGFESRIEDIIDKEATEGLTKEKE